MAALIQPADPEQAQPLPPHLEVVRDPVRVETSTVGRGAVRGALIGCVAAMIAGLLVGWAGGMSVAGALGFAAVISIWGGLGFGAMLGATMAFTRDLESGRPSF